MLSKRGMKLSRVISRDPELAVWEPVPVAILNLQERCVDAVAQVEGTRGEHKECSPSGSPVRRGPSSATNVELTPVLG